MSRMKTYSKPRRRTGASRTRKLLDQMKFENYRERAAVTKQSCEKGARARIQDLHSDETPEQIEGRVARVMKGGLKPTKAKVLEPGKIPPDVVADRRSARKQRVKSGRHRRKA